MSKSALMNKFIAINKQCQGVQDYADLEGRELTAAERTQMQSLLDEADEIQAKIDKLGGFPSAGRQTEPQMPMPQAGILGGGLGRTAGPGAPAGGPAINRTFAGMFPTLPLDNGGFKSEDEFLEVLNSGRYDPRLTRALFTEGGGSEGGYSVPTQYSAQWLDLSLVQEVVRPLAQVWPMTSVARLIPGWDMLNMTGGESFGGFTMQWLAEAGAADQQTGKMRQIDLKADKGAIYCQVSNELIADGLGFSAQLQMALINSITYGYDRAFLRGNGVGRPLGVLNAQSLVTVDKEGGQGADTIVYENLARIFSRMYPSGKKRSVWIANDDTLPQLLQVSIPIGLAGQFYPVMTESNGQYFIFGRPVIFTPVMASLGDFGDIALVDFSQYAIGLRMEFGIDRSQAPGWTQDLDSWRIITRVGGLPTWNSVFTPENGATMSWAVALEERS